MKHKIIAAALSAASVFSAGSAAYAAQHSLVIDATNRTISVDNGEKTDISTRVFSYGKDIYVSIDDVFKACGYWLGWDSDKRAVSVTNPADGINMYIYLDDYKVWDGHQMIHYAHPSTTYHELGYMTMDMFEDLTKGEFEYRIDGTVRVFPRNFRDTLDNTAMTDKYRRSGEVKQFGEAYILDGWFAFERVTITDEDALDYADAVNTIAASAPEGVNVYNMVIPNSCEIYAPKEYTTNLLEQHRKIYNALDDRVIPINIYDNLLDHADEPIYFSTDHHWTQRGAYYAYQSFMDYKGEFTEPLSWFKHSDADGLVGSFATIAAGTEGEELIKKHPEHLERFMPNNRLTEGVFNDCLLQKFACWGRVIKNDDENIAYSCFLGGDMPVTQLHNLDRSDGSTLCILKESYANAFSLWAANNYEYVYLVDIRCFNGANWHTEPFDLRTFYDVVQYDDLLIMNYPNTIADKTLRDYIRLFA